MVPACKRVEVAVFALDADSKLTTEPFLFEVGTEGDLFWNKQFPSKKQLFTFDSTLFESSIKAKRWR